MNRDMNQIPQSVKVRSTCNACQRAKIRCSHERPSCRRCEKHGMDCVYSVSRRLGRPAKKKASRMESIPSDHGSSCESAIPSSNEMKPPKIPTEKTSHQMKQLRTRGKDRQRCKPEEHLGGKTRTLSAIESQSDILGAPRFSRPGEDLVPNLIASGSVGHWQCRATETRSGGSFDTSSTVLPDSLPCSNDLVPPYLSSFYLDGETQGNPILAACMYLGTDYRILSQGLTSATNESPMVPEISEGAEHTPLLSELELDSGMSGLSGSWKSKQVQSRYRSSMVSERPGELCCYGGSDNSASGSVDKSIPLYDGETRSMLSCICVGNVLGQLVQSDGRSRLQTGLLVEEYRAIQDEVLVVANTVLQCRICSRSDYWIHLLMVVILTIDNFLMRLESIAVAGTDAEINDSIYGAGKAAKMQRQRPLATGFRDDSANIESSSTSASSRECETNTHLDQLFMLLATVRKIRVRLQLVLPEDFSTGSSLWMIADVDRRLQLLITKTKV
ncbi:hypothetical protein PDE_06572 [Penicillium oxalicum 114-2]|uniref:Zn(2)-C6 fungal-type domain-containing protein n=1 Tax=Penicillium oxalicum (strain 114-2 / CGMCC 5302) TaxID=933388 RepID=S8B9Y1_PENO1|nr:hypothetical protein PDE_06572 [Penicillium oxalicum 114-2]